jgi:hypothetical protein
MTSSAWRNDAAAASVSEIAAAMKRTTSAIEDRIHGLGHRASET